MARNNGAIEYNIVSRVGRLGKSPAGWYKELNIIMWNNGLPKFDIRDWDPEHKKMSKGITMYEEEARRLLEHLAGCFGMRLVSIDKVAGSSGVQKQSTVASRPMQDASRAPFGEVDDETGNVFGSNDIQFETGSAEEDTVKDPEAEQQFSAMDELVEMSDDETRAEDEASTDLREDTLDESDICESSPEMLAS